MNISIVLTIIAKDQPGIVKSVSEVLYHHGGSWTQSSMSSLAGQFAGILLASVPGERADACVEELIALKSQGLQVIAHVGSEKPADKKTREYILNLVGNDRVGIVHDITTILANHNVTVHELETLVESASMAGGELFKANAKLVVPADADIDILESELENMANELMVDITFHK
jgi:glycine cleavage system regulatory protein